MTLMSGNGSTNDSRGEDSLDGNDSIGTNGKPEFDRQVEQDVDTGFNRVLLVDYVVNSTIIMTMSMKKHLILVTNQRPASRLCIRP